MQVCRLDTEAFTCERTIMFLDIFWNGVSNPILSRFFVWKIGRFVVLFLWEYSPKKVWPGFVRCGDGRVCTYGWVDVCHGFPYFVWLIPSWVCARLLYGTTEISIKDLLRASSTLKSALLTETAVLRDTAFFIKRHHCAGPIQEPKEQNKFVHSWSTILFRLVTPAIILPMIPPSCSKIGSCRWSTHCLLFFLSVFLLGWRYTTRTVFKNF